MLLLDSSGRSFVAAEQSATFSGDTVDISTPGDLDENCTENKVYF